MSFQQFEVVRLVRGVPDDGIPPGTRAVILDVYDDPPGYEVEVTMDDHDGYTMGVSPEDVVPDHD
jgi:Domain of unknown function (DUF4926)